MSMAFYLHCVELIFPGKQKYDSFRVFCMRWANWRTFICGVLLTFARLADSAATLPQSEYLALYDLYNSTSGADWRWSKNPLHGIPWVFDANANPCTFDHWQGVTCIIVNQPLPRTYHVASLVLPKTNLYGPLPYTLENLPYLNIFDLSDNRLTGNIPSSIGNLVNLQQLVLKNNLLSGSIPRSVGNLTKLTKLVLLDNGLTGTIPNSICNMENLLFLDLFRNQLTGTIPNAIGNITDVRYFSMSKNLLTGSIPNTIRNLTNLQFLYLYTNKLTGSIPSIGNLTNLQILDLSANLLSGSIPNFIDSFTNMSTLYLNRNQITGSIPSSIGNLTNLGKVYLNDNQLTGSIPSNIGRLLSLTFLSLTNNHITGIIPSSVGNLRNLQFLDLSANKLFGLLGPLGHLRTLIYLNVKANRFTGPLTDAFSSAQTQLKSVQLDNNQFVGTLPAVVFDLPSLVSFSMVDSCLHGTLPANICRATQLEALILYGLTTGASCRARGVSLLQSRQSFSGTMPSCLLQLPKLATLLLSSNGLTGSIGRDIFLGSKLLQLDLSHNDLTGSIPNSLQNRSWSLLDLSHNKLSGTLHADLRKPEFLSILGNITLDVSNITASPAVSLSGNRLSGPVPSSLRPLNSNLSVLAGNLFECKYDKSDLPQHDSDISNYECASNDFNAAVYAWLSLCVGVALVCRHNLSFISKAALMHMSDEHSSMLTHLHSLLEEYHVLSKAAWCCAAFCLVVLLPYYAIVSHYEGTHTYQYAYVLSAIYTSGVLPFVLDVLLLGLLIALVYGSCIGKYTSLPATTPGSEKHSHDRWRYATVVTIYSLANITVVLGANIAFVYAVLYQSSQVQALAQVLLSLFKLIWSVAASPYLIQQLDLYVFAQQKGPAKSYFALQLLVSLFNNIAIPCLVVAAIDPNCFSNILLPPDSQTVTYLLPTCSAYIFLATTCLKITPELATLQFTPPFTYSYQCSASFITSYAPTFIYMSISTVFVSPVLQYVLLRLHERLPVGSNAHCMVSHFLPRILEPLPLGIPNAVDYRHKPLCGCTAILVNQLTQLGILLTFGAIFPPVALAMAVSITATVLMDRYKMQRFVHAVVEKKLFAYLNIINAECKRVGTKEQMQVAAKILVCYCCAFYTLFLFDTLGDAVGLDTSVWVLVVFPLLPFAVYGTESLWWRSYKFVKGKRNRRSEEEQTVGIELRAMSIAHEGIKEVSKAGGEVVVVHTVNFLHSNNV